MKKLFIIYYLIFLFFINIVNLYSKIGYYPILTVNNETGSRFSYNPLSESEDDYESIDAYRFTRGYLKITENITKKNKIRFKYLYSIKKYDEEINLNNNAHTFILSTLYKIYPDLTGDFSILYKEKKFINNSEKNNFVTSPIIELKYKPLRSTLIGIKYVYGYYNFINNSSDSRNNRILIYYQKSLLTGKLRIRVRYRGENRNYLTPDNLHKNSFKHAISITGKMDFNYFN